jgi:hypothetical protein
MSDTRLMDIEPGGESTQYESIKMYTEPPEKQTGQMGGMLTNHGMVFSLVRQE